MTRRNFLSLLSGAVAAVAGGLAGIATSRPVRISSANKDAVYSRMCEMFGPCKPYEKMTATDVAWALCELERKKGGRQQSIDPEWADALANCAIRNLGLEKKAGRCHD
jgi:hypothetical protein